VSGLEKAAHYNDFLQSIKKAKEAIFTERGTRIPQLTLSEI
jgi:hypothetical protein